MKKAVKKALSLLLTLILVFGVGSTGFIRTSASADSSISAEEYEALLSFSEESGDLFESSEPQNVVEAYATGSFDSGSGTYYNPYMISTAEQLALISKYPSSHFRLANDIVFKESDFLKGGKFYNNENGWVPICSNGSVFSGTFDGNNHVIKGLKCFAGYSYIEYPGTVTAGLFGNVSGTIKNLGLVDCTVFGFGANSKSVIVGGIAALAGKGAVISDCYCTGEVGGIIYSYLIVNSSNRTLSNSGVAGGIVGRGDTTSKIIDCYNECDVAFQTIVSIHPDSSYPANVIVLVGAGGIAASGVKNIENCYNTGRVASTCTSYEADTLFYPTDRVNYMLYSGGIAGLSSNINDCYNTGDVYVAVDNSYLTQNDSILDIAGGILGGTDNNDVENCYNIGNIKGSTLNINCGITGYVEPKGSVNNCYYLDNVSHPAYNEGGYVNAKKCTAEEMKTKSTFTTFDFEDTWYYVPEKEPQLIGTNPKHTVTWIIDERTKTELVTEMEKIVAPANPEKYGYTFIKWTPDVPERMPANDLTFTAVWENNCKHNYIPTVTTPPTCTENGIKTFTCSGCGDAYTESIPVTEHTAGDWIITLEPTTHAEGKKIKKCTGCGITVDEASIARLPKETVKDNAVIKNPSVTTINYGDAIVLHVDSSKIPEGGRVEWTASDNNFSWSANGATCKISPEKTGITTFTATIYDAEGDPILTDSQEMTSKAGLFQKIVAFFKNLFGLTKIYPDIFKF